MGSSLAKHKPKSIFNFLPKEMQDLADKSIIQVSSMIGNMTIKDLVELIPYFSVGYLVYDLRQDTHDVALAMVGLKLASTDGIVSQGAGLGILSTYGICALSKGLQEWAIKLTIDLGYNEEDAKLFAKGMAARFSRVEFTPTERYRLDMILFFKRTPTAQEEADYRKTHP